jgi:ribonuclease-3
MFGFAPEKLDLYICAFTHKSMGKPNNERLEFLGDSIFDAIVTEILVERFQNKKEGDLSKLRAKIVSRNKMNEIGNKLNLLSILEFKNLNATEATTNLPGNTLEALIGALYLDLGYDKTKKIVSKKIIKPFINLKNLDREVVNYKSLLNEWVQKNNHTLVFKIINEQATINHEKFEVALFLNGEQIVTGKGKNKKAAENDAAKKMSHLYLV